MRRKIVGAFVDRVRARLAWRRLEEAGVEPEDIALAPGAISTSEDGPIDQDVVFVVATDGEPARRVLEGAGGRIVAERVERGEGDGG